MKKAITKTDLIVVLICCVLILILSGAAGRAGRMRPKETMCAAKLGYWGQYWQAYVNDHNGLLLNDLHYAGVMESYYGDVKMLKCPSATKTTAEGVQIPFSCWQEDAVSSVTGAEKTYIGSYTFNAWCMTVVPDNRAYEYLWHTPYIAGADMVPLLMDGGGRSMNTVPLPRDDPPEYEGAIGIGGDEEISRVCLNRHNGGINILFLDYSVRKIGLKGLWEIDWSIYWRNHETPEPIWPEWMSDFKDYR